MSATRLYLLKYNIKHVIRLGFGFQNHIDDDSIIYHDYYINDVPNQRIDLLFHSIADSIKVAHEKNENVLVHCFAGVSRSSTIVLAYLMKYHRYSLIDAFKLAYLARPIIRPNSGFSKALSDFELSLFGKRSLDIWWMCESFLNFIEYLDFEYRIGMIADDDFEDDYE